MKKEFFTCSLLIFLTVIFFRGNGSAFDMAEYFPPNQGDEWIYLVNLTVIFHSEDDPISASYLEKQVVNDTEEVNGVETIKVEMGPLGLPPSDFNCYVMDSEGLKRYRTFESGLKK